MTAWRIVSAALGLFLLGLVISDMALERRAEDRVLVYEKGVYLGKQDPGIGEETRAAIRQRGVEAAAW